MSVIADQQQTSQVAKRASRHVTENEKNLTYIYHTLFLAERHSHLKYTEIYYIKVGFALFHSPQTAEDTADQRQWGF